MVKLLLVLNDSVYFDNVDIVAFEYLIVCSGMCEKVC